MAPIVDVNVNNLQFPYTSGTNKSAVTATTVPVGQGNSSPTTCCGLDHTNDSKLDKVMRALFNEYGVSWDIIKADAVKFFHSVMPQCVNLQDRVINLTKEQLEKAKNYIKSLLDTLKKNNQEINFDSIQKAHDKNILKKTEELLKKSNCSENLLKDIEDAGLLHQLARVAGCPVKTLKTKRKEEIQNYVNILKETHNELKVNGSEFSAEELVARANDNRLLSQTSLSREEFEQKVESGEIKGLRELLDISEGERITPKKVQDFFQKQSNRLLEKLESIPQEQQAEFIKNAIETQSKQFKLILVATEHSDRKDLFVGIKNCFAQNRGELFKELLYAIDEQTRIELANSIDDEEIKAILTNPDILGQTVDTLNGTGIVAGVTQYQSQEKFLNFHNNVQTQAEAFFKKEETLAVLEKLKNCKSLEALSAEEKAIASEIHYYISVQSGQMVGVASNDYISDSDKANVLKLFNEDAYKIQETYADVINQMVEYINENPDTLSETDFAILNNSTNGNIAIAQSGNGESLNAPKEDTTPAIGYTNTNLNIDTATQNLAKKTQACIQSTEEQPTFTIEGKNHTTNPNNEKESNTSFMKMLQNMPFVFRNVLIRAQWINNKELILNDMRNKGILYTINNNILPLDIREKAAIEFLNTGELELEDLGKINLPIATKQLIENNYNMHNEEK